MISARIALRVMLAPQVELTDWLLTACSSTPAALAKATRTSCCFSSGWSDAWISRLRPDEDVRSTILMLSVLIPWAASTPVAWSGVNVCDGTSHDTPPSKSMPRFRPLTPSDTSVIRISSAEMPRPIHRRP